MNAIENITRADILYSFGWTLIHSIWIGAIVMLIVWGILHLFKKSPSTTRYFISVGGLLVFFLLVIYTFFQINNQKGINPAISLNTNNSLINLSKNILEASNLNQMADKISIINIENYINQNIPFLVVIWLLGLTFFSFRFLGGLIFTYRLRSTSKSISTNNEYLRELIKNICKKIGLNSSVRIKESPLISSPTVIGFIKPVILFPLGMANGLSTHQVEAVLFHEIAHIYRFDYLVNLIQSMVEVVLFYHPAVWWLSANIRNERENICDDIAIKHTGNAINYAKTLADLQELKHQTPDIVLAFSNQKNRFMNRIRRLLGLPQIKNNFIEGIISSVLLIVSIALLTINSGTVFGQNTPATPSMAPEMNQNNDLTTLQQDTLKKEKTNTGIQHEKGGFTDTDKALDEELKLIKLKINDLQQAKTKNNINEKTFDFQMKLLQIQASHLQEWKKINLSNLEPDIKEEKIQKLRKEFFEKQSQLTAIESEWIKDDELQLQQKQMQQQKEAYSKQIQEFEHQHKITKEQMEQIADYESKAKADQAIKKEQLAKMEMELKNEQLTPEIKEKLKQKHDEIEAMQEKIEFTIQKEKNEMLKQQMLMNDKEDEIRAKEMQMKAELLKAREAETRMIKEEMAHQKLLDIFSKNLVADGLKSKNGQTEFVLSRKALTINGKKQSKKLFDKYSKLLAESGRQELMNDEKFILNLD